jgi:hypothetical protein
MLRRRMKRSFAVTVLSCLLLFMQQGAAWHSLTHLDDWLQRPHEQGLQLPHEDGSCPLCALFTGGSSAAPNDAVVAPAPVGGSGPLLADDSTTTASAPSFYLTRAPPVRS